ncbi:hypothetical protein B0H17DRAFT_1034919 [Mycena rosella]|uniref:F-box domain-containing protein n=1 Tax=Mycena rosella TaxID=1033263 RepID=A0AAD7M9I7_MYCRO|nr:hypothetical protein B0H17DRAFT_1034919 [Mycena rosella]
MHMYEMGTWGKVIELIRSWLSRARKAPLSLRLVSNPEGMWGSDDSARSILQIALDLSPQCRNIEVDLTPTLAELFLPLHGTFPLLEKLTIDVLDDFPSPLSFRDAPKLRQFSAPMYYPTHHSSVQLPWHQITTFRISSIQFSDCLAILRDGTNVVDATFDVEADDSDRLSVQPISVPPLIHLLSLTVVGSEESGQLPTDLLHFLTAPALKNLTLDFCHVGDLDISPFILFVSRSSIRLHTLSLSLELTPDAIIQCLQVLPSLAYLKMAITPLLDIQFFPLLNHVEALFRAFTGNHTFLPNLESLHIILTDLVVVSATVFELLHWRWTATGITRLRSFQLAHKYDAPLLDKIVNSSWEFRRLAAEGMDLYFGLLRPVVDH